MVLCAMAVMSIVTLIDSNRGFSTSSVSNPVKPMNKPSGIEGLYGTVDQGRFVPLQPQLDHVLVTGAAGFIGMSLSARLGSMGIDVAGVDDYNAYYSVDLKRARAKYLKETYRISVVDGNVCNRSMISSLLQGKRITHIVHLAAQPGVRYSFTHPMVYVEKNVECFVELLEAIVSLDKKSLPHLVYASSSSVYGQNKKMPFSEADRADMPSNLYGATKRSNEQIALSYNNLYGLQSVGCRFFTVYGPWGRPDMAAYKFTDKIMKGEPIPIYNGGKMKRDFTFIDDIVDGIIAALKWRDTKGEPQVFNLGNHQPVELKTFIRELEIALGRNATIHDAGRSPGEVAATFADISLSQRVLGFEPKTKLRVGLKRFVEWYKSDLAKPEFSTVAP